MYQKKFNTPSNNLDQASKARVSWYNEITNSIKKEIEENIEKKVNEAMAQIIWDWNDAACNYIKAHCDKFTLKELLALKPWDYLGFYIEKEKLKTSEPIQSLIIAVIKDEVNPKFWKVRTKQLEKPIYSICWSPLYVSDEKFHEILWMDYKKNSKNWKSLGYKIKSWFKK